MPQFGRKKAFSAAKKKKQLQDKREKKRQKDVSDDFIITSKPKNDRVKHKMPKDKNTNFLELVSNSPDAQTLRTLFRRDSDEIVQKGKEWARQPLGDRSQLKPSVLGRFQCVDFPVRPPWPSSFKKEDIESREDEYFVDYIKGLYSKYGEKLNHFEHNIEVWRQLWRVLELSDMFLLIADMRHPLFHFPTSLYEYITEIIKKPVILLLNKCDLIPKEIQILWIKYFKENYPKVHIALFTAFNDDKSIQEETPKNKKRGLRKKPDYTLVAKLWEKIKEVSPKKNIDPKSFDDMIKKTFSAMNNEIDTSEHFKKEDKVQVNDEHLTIGLIGHPNVGKSCVLNALVGKHVVSASYTPGHTKHFQTFFVHEQIKLCDSPGLVFPAINMPKQLQVLCGIYPISQVREPFSAIHYLAERVRVEEILKLPFPKDIFEEETDDPSLWSGWLICVAYAEKWKLTTKTGRLDEFRAANRILRETLYGNILLYFEPPEGVTYETKAIDFDQLNSMTTLSYKPKVLEANYSDNEEEDEVDTSEESQGEDEEEYSEESEEEIAPSRNAFALLGDDNED